MAGLLAAGVTGVRWRLPWAGPGAASAEHGLEQGGPVRDAEPLREEPQFLEESSPGARPLPALAPQVGDAVHDGVQHECEQVQRCEQVGETVAAVAKVALDFVAVARQAVEGLLDLPARPSGPRDRDRIVCGDLQAGEERVGIAALAVALDGVFDLGTAHGVVTVAHRDRVHPADALRLPLALAVAGLEAARGMHQVGM